MSISVSPQQNQLLNSLFAKGAIDLEGNLIASAMDAPSGDQIQTNDAFSHKWTHYEASTLKEEFYLPQRKWFLDLYGFENEEELASYLRTKSVVLDAGCGVGYKTAWLASLSPETLFIGMDYSEAVYLAARRHPALKNLYWVRGDIAQTGLKDAAVDLVICDQVIMHTNDPEATFKELCRVLAQDGEFFCYFYAKKALPRELIDDYFRTKCKDLSVEELTAFSEQMTELGKSLTDLQVDITVPNIPLLQIKAGTYPIQRFIYWNFLKCFWNEEFGWDSSVMINFDWYSPSNAKRFSEEEVQAILHANHMQTVFFHQEEACYSGRFCHQMH